MPQTLNQLLLDLEGGSEWDQLPEVVRGECIQVLSLLLRKVWEASKKESDDE